MEEYINLTKNWDAITESIYNLLSAQPNNELANQIITILEEHTESDLITKLPCKIGTTIYEITERRRNGEWIPCIAERTIHSFEISNNCVIGRCGTTLSLYASELNKKWFLSKEKAREKLAQYDVGCDAVMME